MALKDVLKEARLKKNLKQEDAAKLVGVTVQTYSKWENGKTEPKASQVVKLSDVLGVSVYAICKGEIGSQMEPMEFLREYSNISKSMNPVDEVMTIWGSIDNHEEFLNIMFSNSQYPEDVVRRGILEEDMSEKSSGK